MCVAEDETEPHRQIDLFPVLEHDLTRSYAVPRGEKWIQAAAPIKSSNAPHHTLA